MQQRANLPDPSRSLEKRLIAIALQGGGSHGAFTWGVLDRLSGGVNAGVLADGLRRGGASQAQLALSILERSRPPAGIRDPVATVTDVEGERGCLSNRVCGSECIRRNPRRIHQAATATKAQAAVAPKKAMATWVGTTSQITAPNAASPKLPRAAPAASSAAASLPRWVPRSPAFSLRWRSCFSTRVALAGKIAGKARKSPPATGPNSLAMSPASIVVTPPSNNRTAYSCHRVSRRLDSLTRMGMTLSQEQPGNEKSAGKPGGSRKDRGSRRMDMEPLDQLTGDDAIEAECQSTDDHRSTFDGRVG
jgi:hypothetical protein